MNSQNSEYFEDKLRRLRTESTPERYPVFKIIKFELKMAIDARCFVQTQVNMFKV